MADRPDSPPPVRAALAAERVDAARNRRGARERGPHSSTMPIAGIEPSLVAAASQARAEEEGLARETSPGLVFCSLARAARAASEEVEGPASGEPPVFVRSGGQESKSASSGARAAAEPCEPDDGERRRKVVRVATGRHLAESLGELTRDATLPKTAFLRRLYDVCETCDPAQGSWSEDGTTFIVKSSAFVDTLRAHFKSSLQTFVRQLHIYNFRKADNGVTWSFSNPHFVQGKPELLANIRRSPGGRRVPHAGEGAGGAGASSSSSSSAVGDAAASSASPYSRPEKRLREGPSSNGACSSSCMEGFRAVHGRLDEVSEELRGLRELVGSLRAGSSSRVAGAAQAAPPVVLPPAAAADGLLAVAASIADVAVAPFAAATTTTTPTRRDSTAGTGTDASASTATTAIDEWFRMGADDGGSDTVWEFQMGLVDLDDDDGGVGPASQPFSGAAGDDGTLTTETAPTVLRQASPATHPGGTRRTTVCVLCRCRPASKSRLAEGLDGTASSSADEAGVGRDAALLRTVRRVVDAVQLRAAAARRSIPPTPSAAVTAPDAGATTAAPSVACDCEGEGTDECPCTAQGGCSV